MFKTVLVAATLAAGAMAADLTVNTPGSLVECQPVLLSWTGGVAPYYLSVIPGGQPSAAALIDFGQTSDTSKTWNVNLAAGTSVSVKIVDSTGATNYDQQQTVLAGSSTECLTASSGTAAGASSETAAAAAGTETQAAAAAAGTSVAAAGSSAAASVAAAGTSAAAAGTSAAASHASSGAASASKASTTASAAASSSSVASSAGKIAASTGLLAVFGAAALAFF